MFTTLTPTQVLDVYWNRDKIPIDSLEIAKNAGFKLEEINENSMGRYSKRPKIISFNSAENSMRVRFTVANLLARHFMNFGNCEINLESFSIHSPDILDSYANNYAMRLLIPKGYIEAVYFGQGVKTVEELSEKFGVSKLLMIERIKSLDLLPR